MNNLNRSRKESGVGLIEILIVLVVLVIGWAAIAALQGKLMSGSSVTKARNIAQELAREKTEELRTAVEKGQYSTAFEEDPTITDEEIINAEFTRSWTVGDVTLATGATVDNLKQLVMTVTWKGNDYDLEKDNLEKVVLNTMIAFADPVRSTFLEPGEPVPGGFAPINFQTGREGPGTVADDSVPILDNDGDGDPDTTDDNTYTAVDDEGNPVVYQGIPIAGEFENGFTAYGGKIIKFSGTIYYDYDGDHPYVQASSPSFCSAYYGTSGECLTGDSDIICAKYVCYVGGDCSNGGVGCPGDVADLPKLNGGWYGKIGDFFPGINPLKFPTICMSDPLKQTDDSGISVGLPSRLFVTKRIDDTVGTGFTREGINKSFEGYDTLISFKYPKNALCEDLLIEMRTDYPTIAVDPIAVPRQLADYEVIRCLPADETNVVLPSTGFDPAVAPNIVPNDCQLDPDAPVLPGG